jgi:predicted DNA-binding transcriptional regulator AlpA
MTDAGRQQFLAPLRRSMEFRILAFAAGGIMGPVPRPVVTPLRRSEQYHEHHRHHAAHAAAELAHTGQLATADPDDLRSALVVDRALASYFNARADIVAEALARRQRNGTSPPADALGIAEVMRRTGMSNNWLYRHVRAGALPFARRLGRRVTFDAAGLERWVARRR